MGEVVLGMPGQWAENYREKADHYTTKIGGLPDWPIPDVGIRPELLQCSLCGGKLCLVAQVYAPISMPKLNIEERVIYVLGCPTRDCGSKPQSWRALRVQKCHGEMQNGGNSPKPMPLEEVSAPIKEIGSSFEERFPTSSLEEYDDDSDSEIDMEELAQAFAEAASLASQSKKQNGHKRSNVASEDPIVKQVLNDASTSVLPCFYIYSEKEHRTGKIHAFSGSYSSIFIKDQSTSSDCEDGEKWEGESYEYDRALGADRTFLKFKKQLDAHPEQCFRYSYGGSALLAAKEFPKPGTCNLCGSLRHYELQLMPPLLYFLHEAADDSSACSANEWTWMTLIIYTCPKSCCPSSCRENPGSCCWQAAEEEIVIQDD
ncbi:uncharacterized protein [Typha angustifolia]|uniref:uncharacterized protein isoform X1 n=2 Tax=Typha angustifolia TaxID=59011 RepID=UPI003C2D1257